MPLQQCQTKGVRGWRWGKRGKCYIGARARKRALSQAAAIRASGFTENRAKVVASNPLKADPTRTATLRRIYQQDVARRYNLLKRKVMVLVVVEDAFGLKRVNRSPFLGNAGETVEGMGTNSGGLDSVHRGNGGGLRSPTLNQRWKFHTDPAKVEEFNKWLQIEMQTGLDSVAPDANDLYYRRYVERGYRQGAGRAFDDTRKAALSSDQGAVSDFYAGTKDEFLRSSFARPVAIDKVKLLTGRVFTDIQGVNAVMATRLTRELAEGLTQGKNPRDIARSMVKNLDMSKRQAMQVARTEIIRAHAEGQLDALESLGVTEVGVMVEWSAAGDDRVCPLCEALGGVVMTIKEARGLIPRHAQCRCAHIPANIGESTKGQIRGRKDVRQAIDESIRREIPIGRDIKGVGRRFKSPETRRFTVKGKRTLAEQKKLSRWAGADKTIAKRRPKSILGEIDAKPKPPTPKAPRPKPVVRRRPTVKPRRRRKLAEPIDLGRVGGERFTTRVPGRTVISGKPEKIVRAKPKVKPPSLEKEIVSKERELQKLTKERVVVFDKKGNILASQEGTETGVNSFLKKERIKGTTVLHNHPLTDKVTPSTFSVADIQTAVTKEIGEMRLIASNGDRFSMKFGNKLKSMTDVQRRAFAKQIGEDWKIAAKRKLDRIERDLTSGKLLRKDALKKIVGVSDEAWKSTAKINGLEYRNLKSFRGTAKATKTLEQRAKSILQDPALRPKVVPKPKPKVSAKPKPPAIEARVKPFVEPSPALMGAEEQSVKAWVAGAATDIRAKEVIGDITKSIKTFHRALDKSPVHKGLVYRGMTTDAAKLREFASLKKGAIIEYNASASAAKSREVSRRFAQPGGIFSRAEHNKSVMFNVKSKTGADISAMNTEQAEVILRKNSRYRVVRVDSKPSDVDLVVHLEEL